MQVVGFGDRDLRLDAPVRYGRMAYADKDSCRKGAVKQLVAYADMEDKMCFGAYNGTSGASE